jgi:hypothetical protein
VCARGDDHRHPSAQHQVRHQLGQPSIVAVSETLLDENVAAFDETGLAEAFAEGRDHACAQLGRTWIDKSDHRDRALLRARRKRPNARGADKRDELAPSHALPLRPRSASYHLV